MNAEFIMDALGLIDDDLIENAMAARSNVKKQTINWKRWGALAACLTFILAISISVLHNYRNEYDEGSFDMSRSDSGITVKYVERIDNLPQSDSELVYYTEQELLTAWNTDIFHGTVVSIRNIEIDYGIVDGWKSYRAIAKIRVDKVIRGTATIGDTVSVLLNCPIDTDIWVEDNDVIENLRIGQPGIFMPLKHDDENSVYSHGGKQIDKRDLAEYSFLDGSRYAFLETDTGLLFARWAYESISSATTLDEIEQYIIEMIE